MNHLELSLVKPGSGTTCQRLQLHRRAGVLVALAGILLIGCAARALGQTLPLPPREADALSGSDFIDAIVSLPQGEREERILAEVREGNVPGFLRALKPVTVRASIGGVPRVVTYHVAPDYLAIGSDADYFLCPMTPLLAQKICDALDCTLPTRRMVNQIWTNAAVKLAPRPIPPSREMVTVPVFARHNALVRAQRLALLDSHPLGELVCGDKKDVVISSRIYSEFANAAITNPVVIYGWHRPNGLPIQPLYNGHAATYADYSHGVRLVQMAVTLNGQPDTVTNILASPTLHPLLSDEGVIRKSRYPIR